MRASALIATVAKLSSKREDLDTVNCLAGKELAREMANDLIRA